MTRCLLITGRDHGQPYLAHEFERIPDKLSQLRHWLPSPPTRMVFSPQIPPHQIDGQEAGVRILALTHISRKWPHTLQ